MRYVYVHYTDAQDTVVCIPDEVEDTDLYLESTLHGAAGWGEAKNSIREAIEEWRNR